MANVRTLNKDKYKLSKYRFRELYYFCLQYDEWKDQLEDKRNTLKALQYSGMPTAGNTGNQTEAAAIACADISEKLCMIEQAAKEADPELWKYILYAVTNEDITFDFLKIKKDMPCERDRYYNSRRKFYFILDSKMRRKDRA